MSLHALRPGFVGRLGTLFGKLVVEILSTVRGSVGDDFRPDKGLSRVAVDFVEGGQEVLDGLPFEFLVADVRGVDVVEDLSFLALLDDRLVAVGLQRGGAGALDEHVGGVDTVGDFLHGKLPALLLVLHDAAEFERGLLHAVHIVEMDFLPDGAAVFGDDLVVVLHFLALVPERGHLGFASVIDENGGDFEDGLRVEVVRGIGHGHIGVDVACDSFKNLGVAFHNHILRELRHLLGRGACRSCQSHDRSCQKIDSFFHYDRN